MSSRGWTLVAIVVAAALVAMVVADLSGGLLNELLLYVPGVDKVMHVAGGAILYVAGHHFLGYAGRTGPSRMALAVCGASALTMVDEFQQQFTSDRSVELADVVAGHAGILAAVSWQVVRTRRVMAIVGLLTAAVIGGLLTHDSYLQTRDYNRGLLAERAGDKVKAREHYLAAVAVGVRNPEAYNAAAWMILETGDGDPRAAVRHAARSLELRPDNPDALDTYGWALFRVGRVADAVKPLERALAGKADIYCIHYHLGMAYLETGRLDEGLLHLRLQIEKMPQTAEASLAADALARFEAPRAR